MAGAAVKFWRAWFRAGSLLATLLAKSLGVLLAGAAPAGAAQPWDGPVTGPPALPEQRVAVVADNLQNAGAQGVTLGLREAASVLGWHIIVQDAAGNPAKLDPAFQTALADQPDALILIALDAQLNRSAYAGFAESHGIPVVGWHVGAKPGPVGGTPVAVNITTPSNEVAHLVVATAIQQSDGHAGIVILTDESYAIAVAKAHSLATAVRDCGGCSLLEIVNIPLGQTAALMPSTLRSLITQRGDRLTYLLAVNDLYFDDAIATLREIGLKPGRIALISAGDGSATALDRIRTGNFQTATVAEPLNLQGWQLLDEVNRLLHHQPVSGFIAPPHLFDRSNIDRDGGNLGSYDPDNQYRAIYRQIWQPGTNPQDSAKPR